MNAKALRSVFFTASVLMIPVGAAPPAFAADGQIRFQGSIVDAGCPIATTGHVQPTHAQRVDVSQQHSVWVGTYRNVCSNDVMPFSTQYTEIKPRSQTSDTATLGLVTVTYH